MPGDKSLRFGTAPERAFFPTGSSELASQKEIVLVHSSDLHVDDGYTARQWGGDGNRPLRAVLDVATGLDADIVLLTGDTFEHNRLPETLLEETLRILGDAGREIVVLPGNHDPATDDSVWHRGGLHEPDNVHILGITHRHTVTFPEHDLEIWGRAHRDYEDMVPLAKPRRRKARWHIVLAHGHYEAKPDPKSTLRPSWLISADEIHATEADYVALGHWNTPKRVAGGKARAYYSGSPDLAGTVNHVRLTSKGVQVGKAPVILED